VLQLSPCLTSLTSSTFCSLFVIDEVLGRLEHGHWNSTIQPGYSRGSALT